MQAAPSAQNSNEYTYDVISAKYARGFECRADFSWPEHVLDEWARRQPDTAAIRWVSSDFSKERVTSYAQLSDLSHRAAVAFERAGIKKGDKVSPREASPEGGILQRLLQELREILFAFQRGPEESR